MQNPLSYPGLTFRQTEFCRHYALGCSAQQAAVRAGYSQSFAEHKAYRLLRTPAIQACVRAFLQSGHVAVPDEMILRAFNSLNRILSHGENEYAVVSAARILLREKRLSPTQAIPTSPLTLPPSEEPDYLPEAGLSPEQTLELLAESEEHDYTTQRIDPTDDTQQLQLEQFTAPGDAKALVQMLKDRLDEETKSPEQVEHDRVWKETLARRQARYERTGSYYGPNGEDED